MDYLKTQIQELNTKIEEVKKLLEDPSLSALAKEEIANLEAQRDVLQNVLEGKGTVKEISGDAIIIEIRAAAGGDESGLFASDLYRMYTRFAAEKGWKVEQLSINEGGLGNIKEVVLRVVGKGSYEALRFESGVHRVQRVPLTESSGRIHTSTATVAVLPEVTEKELQINPADLRIETFRSGGHGGQNVQKVETAVRIVHTPTGLMATCQTERSQFQNKERALNILRSRVYDFEQQKEKEGLDNERKEQIGSGDRSEKIRTYNFPQDRITDHRINKSWHNIEEILNGHLDQVVSDLKNAK